MNPDPRSTYTQLLAERQAEIAARREAPPRFGLLAAGGRGVRRGHRRDGAYSIPSFLSCGRPSPSWCSWPSPCEHERLLRKLERRRRAAHFFERGLARLEGRWAGTGETGDRYLDPPIHTPAISTCSARDRSSSCSPLRERTLARTPWRAGCCPLPTPPRYALVRKPSRNCARAWTLREELAILTDEVRTGIDPVALAAWGKRRLCWSPDSANRNVGADRPRAAGLAASSPPSRTPGASCTFPMTLSHFLRDFFLVALLVNGTFLYRFRKKIAPVVAAVEEAAHELKLLSETLVRLERETFRSPLLAALRESLNAAGSPPSRRMARLGRLTEYLDSADHIFVRIAEPIVLWTTHLAFAVETWRRESGPAVRRWLTAVGEIEALCSLASHAFEHPADPFPGIPGRRPVPRSRSHRPSAHPRGSRRPQQSGPRRRAAASWWSAVQICPARAPCCAPLA